MKPSTVSVVDPETMTEILKIQTGSMPHGSEFPLMVYINIQLL